jgi:hypothetical protein
VPNVSALNFIKQALLDLKAQASLKTVIMEHINTPLSPIDRLSGQKINKKL